MKLSHAKGQVISSELAYVGEKIVHVFGFGKVRRGDSSVQYDFVFSKDQIDWYKQAGEERPRVEEKCVNAIVGGTIDNCLRFGATKFGASA
jgi:hypothetical protein